MKVAKQVRLLSKNKDGKFIKNDTYEVKRSRAVIQESVIKESEANYKEVGLLWIVDNKATQEWQDSKKPNKKPTAKKTAQKEE